MINFDFLRLHTRHFGKGIILSLFVFSMRVFTLCFVVFFLRFEQCNDIKILNKLPSSFSSIVSNVFKTKVHTIRIKMGFSIYFAFNIIKIHFMLLAFSISVIFIDFYDFPLLSSCYYTLLTHHSLKKFYHG